MSRLLTSGIIQQKRKAVTLGFETFVAPATFDRTAQPVDIYDVFVRYYILNNTAKWIYSVTNATVTTTPAGGTSYRYGYELSGTSVEYDLAAGDSITWNGSATKRWVITNHTSISPIVCSIGGLNQGAEWLYCGSLVSSFGSNSNPSLTYIHIGESINITSIGNYCFQGSNLTGILTIPATCTAIGIFSFRQLSKLTGSLIIPSITIGTYAFYLCTGFTSLVLSSSLTTIGAVAFAGCSNIANAVLEIPNSVTSIGDSAFGGLTKIQSLTLGNQLLTIGTSAFSGCTGLNGSLVFPNSLTTIGGSAFFNCTGLDNDLIIPANITSIGEAAFGYCNFSGIDVSANPSRYENYDDVLYQISSKLAIYCLKSNTNTVTIKSDTLRIGNYCFASCNRTGTLNLPSTLTSVGEYSFSASKFTGTITIPNQVTSLGIGAFSNNAGFTGLVFTPTSSVISINASCFSETNICNSVTISLPATLTSLGDRVFQSAGTGLTTLNIDSATTLSITNFWFHTTAAYAQVNFSNTITSFSITANNGGYLLPTGTLTIPASLTTFVIPGFLTGSGNFLTSISSSSTNYPDYDNVLYDSKTSGSIKAMASARSYSGTLDLMSGTTSIEAHCFNGNTLRTGNIVILSTVTTIATSAFNACTGFAGALTIDSPSIAITAGAFTGCTNLTALNLCANYASTYLTFNFSNNFSAASLNQSLINITNGTKTFTIGATNKARLLAAYPTAETDANARGITIV